VLFYVGMPKTSEKPIAVEIYWIKTGSELEGTETGGQRSVEPLAAQRGHASHCPAQQCITYERT
jgi:hypothetical protein